MAGETKILEEMAGDLMNALIGCFILLRRLRDTSIDDKSPKPKRTRKLTFRPFTKKMAAQARTMHEEGTKSAVVIARKLGGVDPAKVRNLLNGA